MKIKTSHHLHLNEDNIKFYWQIEAGNSNKGLFRQLVLPSLHTDLIFIIEGSLFVNGNQVKDAFVSPVLNKWKEIELEPNTVLFGVRFNPVHFHRFSGIELCNLDQRPNPLKLVLPDRKYNELTSRVLNADSFEDRTLMLDSYFCDQFQKTGNLNESLINTLNFITRNPNTTVKELSSLTGYSERWIQKIYNRTVGISPSKAIQIARFTRFLILVSNNSVQSLSEASLKAGYSDQSHLIRDVKKYSSHTPKKYSNHLPRFIEIMNCS